MTQDETRLVVVLAALFLAALTLRPQLIAVAPLYARIEATFGLSHTAGGLLTAIPVLGLGLFAPLASLLTSRFGPDRATTLCIMTLGLFGLGRAAAPNTLSLLLATVGVGMAMGAAGALLPVAVKAGAPGRPAFATGIYAAGIQLGAAATALTAVPIAGRAGWRGSLALFSVVTVFCALAWAAIGRSRPSVTAPRRHRLPLRDPFAWRLAAVFGLQAMPYFGLNAWLPAYLLEQGWDAGTAGVAQGVMNLSSLVASLVIPLFMDRHGHRRPYLMTSAAVVVTALLVLLVRPSAAWPAVVVLGVAMGVLFATGLVLPLDVADDPATVAATSSMILGVGYVGAASAPVLLGALRDYFGGFSAPLWTLILAMAGLMAVAAPLSSRRLRAGVRLPTHTRSEPPGPIKEYR